MPYRFEGGFHPLLPDLSCSILWDNIKTWESLGTDERSERLSPEDFTRLSGCGSLDIEVEKMAKVLGVDLWLVHAEFEVMCEDDEVPEIDANLTCRGRSNEENLRGASGVLSEVVEL
jgi:hypothetical protein